MKVGIPDFDKVEAGFEALPPGTYQAKVTGCEPRKGKEKGTPYIAWELTVDGPTHSGRKLFENTGYADAKSQPFTKAMVVGCGVPFNNAGFNTEDCLGRRVSLVLGQAMNNRTNKLDNTIDKISPIQ